MKRLPHSLLLVIPLVLSKTVVVRIINNDHPALDYEPAGKWMQSNSSHPCAGCQPMDPTFTLNNDGSYTNGTNIVPFTDPDDLPGSNGTDSSGPSKVRRRSFRQEVLRKRGKNSGADGTSGDGDNDSDDHKSSSSTAATSKASSSSPAPIPNTSAPLGQEAVGKSTTHSGEPSQTLSTSGPGFTTGPDGDDPNFVPTFLTLTFRFTGQSVALHAILPTFNTPGMTAVTNVSFTLDGLSGGDPQIFVPTANSSDTANNIYETRAIFSASGLPDGPHILVATVQPSSVLLVDYINYTAFDTDPLPGSLAAASATASAGTIVTKHNIATFAAAISASLGVMTIMAVTIWLSIWRRRRASRLRLKKIEEQEASEARRFGLDPAEVRTVPFVPRFFPGTIVPDPPPYEAGADSNNGTMRETSEVGTPPISIAPSLQPQTSLPAISISTASGSPPGQTHTLTLSTGRFNDELEVDLVDSDRLEPSEMSMVPLPPGLGMRSPIISVLHSSSSRSHTPSPPISRHPSPQLRPSSSTGQGEREDAVPDLEMDGLLRQTLNASEEYRDHPA